MKIEDNSKISEGELAAIPKLAKTLTNTPLSELIEAGVFLLPADATQLRNSSKDQYILKHDSRGYWTSNIMGFFNYEAENLTITSRFATAQNDYFLNYLLARVLRLPAVFHGFVPAEAQDHLLDMLPYVFAAYLREAMRKGPYRCYVETIERDSNVRGRIDLNSQIQTGNWYDGKIVYRRRELVADNFVMQLVRLVIDQLAGRKSLVPLLQTIRPEVAQVRELTSSCPGRLSRLIYQNLQRPVRHAYYHEYRQLQRLAILIATHRSALLGAGNRRLMGVAFDGASLWEEYLAQILPAGFEHPNNRLQKGGRPLFEEYQSGSRIGRVYPDYIGSVDHRAVVADAKYKPMGNIGGDDYLQMLAYILRFESPRGVFLFPEKQGKPSLSLLQVLKGINSPYEVRRDPQIDVLKIGLPIPQADADYQTFVADMEQNEKQPSIFKSSATMITNP